MIAGITLIDVAADEWVATERSPSTFDVVDATELAGRASEALAAGDDGEAMRLANEALAVEGKNALAWRVLTYCLGSMGRHQEAIESALSAVRHGGHAAVDHYTHAWALFGAHKPNEALTAVDEALEVESQFPDALSLRAVIRHELGDTKGAVEDMREAQGLNGHGGDAPDD